MYFYPHSLYTMCANVWMHPSCISWDYWILCWTESHVTLGRSPKQPAFALKKRIWSASSIIIYILCIGISFPVWSFVVGILLAIIDTGTITRKKSPNRSRIIFWFLFDLKFVELLCRHGNCDLSDKLWPSLEDAVYDVKRSSRHNNSP